MEGNRRHSKMEQLPLDIKDGVNSRLIGGKTYEDIQGYLLGRGHKMSLSMIQRYANSYLQAFEELQLARDFAKIIAEDNADRPSTELFEAASSLAAQHLMHIIIDKEADAKTKLRASGLLASLQSAQTGTERAKMTARKEGGAIKAAMNALKAKVYDEMGEKHPELAAKILEIADGVAGENGHAEFDA